ncbi:MAG: hypothetical protein ACO4CG_05715 [Prochlorothrix sp.]|nr:FHA domain-containing protein [Prochlorothrix sp.]
MLPIDASVYSQQPTKIGHPDSHVCVLIVEDEGGVRSYKLERAIYTIGRSPEAHIRLYGKTCSRKQATLIQTHHSPRSDQNGPTSDATHHHSVIARVTATGATDSSPHLTASHQQMRARSYKIFDGDLASQRPSANGTVVNGYQGKRKKKESVIC